MDEILRQFTAVARGMWRRRWIGLAVAWVLAIIGAAVIARIPDRYEASARVFVDTQTILKPLMSGLAIEPDIDAQVGMLARTLLTRPNLEQLIRKADLDHSVADQKQRDALLDTLQKDVRLASSGRENLYTISFRDSDPQRARRVVDSLVTLFVESSLGDKRRDTEQARSFIDEQIKAHEKRLAEAENRLKDFKLRHMGFDESGKDYFARISQFTEELNRLRVELSVAEQARDALKRELAGEAPVLLPENAAQDTTSQATAELDARIEAQQRLLDELLRRYTDQHPDVIGARRLIAQLETQRRQEIEARRKQAAASGAGRFVAATNPVFQQIKISLAEAEANVAALRARYNETQANLNRLRASATKVPQIEAEFAQLNRDYEIIRRNYDQLVARREQASMSEEVDVGARLADFRVIDPPRVNNRPVFPNRMVLIPFVMLAALAGGAFVCFVLAQLFPTYDSTKMLRAGSQRPVLGAITMIVSDSMRQKARRQNFAFGTSLAVLLLLHGAWMAWVSVISTRF